MTGLVVLAGVGLMLAYIAMVQFDGIAGFLFFISMIYFLGTAYLATIVLLNYYRTRKQYPNTPAIQHVASVLYIIGRSFTWPKALYYAHLRRRD